MKCLALGFTQETGLRRLLPFFPHDEAKDEEDAYSLLTLSLRGLYRFDTVVAVMLPIPYSFVRGMRERKLHHPLMCLLRTPESRRVDFTVELLNLGADEVLQVPCAKAEFYARLDAVCRRGLGRDETCVEFHGFKLRTSDMSLWYGEKPVHMTTTEMRMLYLLVEHLGRIISKGVFMEDLYPNPDEQPEEKILDVMMCKVRKRLMAECGRNIIRTAWGRGYSIPVQLSEGDTFVQMRRTHAA